MNMYEKPPSNDAGLATESLGEIAVPKTPEELAAWLHAKGIVTDPSLIASIARGGREINASGILQLIEQAVARDVVDENKRDVAAVISMLRSPTVEEVDAASRSKAAEASDPAISLPDHPEVMADSFGRLIVDGELQVLSTHPDRDMDHTHKVRAWRKRFRDQFNKAFATLPQEKGAQGKFSKEIGRVKDLVSVIRTLKVALDWELCTAIAQYFDVSVDWLFSTDDYPQK